jgi:hypothetical protein
MLLVNLTAYRQPRYKRLRGKYVNSIERKIGGSKLKPNSLLEWVVSITYYFRDPQFRTYSRYSHDILVATPLKEKNTYSLAFLHMDIRPTSILIWNDITHRSNTVLDYGGSILPKEH